MQLGLVVLVLVMLSSLCSSSTEDHQAQPALPRRHRRGSTEGAPPCPKGCERCSEYNGCVKCKPKLFIFLERNDIRQIGVCLASCPMGYFGMRNPETNRCTQCKIENCEACFNRNFCTKCQEGFYSHRGRCHMTCPPGLASTNRTMECIGQSAVECELSDWSAWSPCMKKNKTCGFKNGSQDRLRTPLQSGPGAEGPPGVPPAPRPCGPQTERKKCVVVKTPCPRGRKNKGERRHEPSARGERENGRGRGRDGREGRGGGGGGGGGGTKRRKAQSQVSPAPSPTPSPTPSPVPSPTPGSVG